MFQFTSSDIWRWHFKTPSTVKIIADFPGIPDGGRVEAVEAGNVASPEERVEHQKEKPDRNKE